MNEKDLFARERDRKSSGKWKKSGEKQKEDDQEIASARRRRRQRAGPHRFTLKEGHVT